MALTSAAPYLALLQEPDSQLKSYGLQLLNEVVDQLWAEIANSITLIEELYEDEGFAKRHLAALVALKVYYNLGDFDLSVRYLLASGDEFNINERSEYVETIVLQCISRYVAQLQQRFLDPLVAIDSQLLYVYDKMLERCIAGGELRLALGISLEAYRLDVVRQVLLGPAPADESGTLLLDYTLTCVTLVINNSAVRRQVLQELMQLVVSQENPDYYVAAKIIIQLNDPQLAARLFVDLLSKEAHATAYQAAFDLVHAALQELLLKTVARLEAELPQLREAAKVVRILGGVPSCDLDVTFLTQNNATDLLILSKTKSQLDGRNSIYHSAVTFLTAFMYAGTTDDLFFRSNLEWLGKATNWSKFSATAALGVIHRGNLSQGRTILQPYLPGNSGLHFTKGGSLYALGLIYAGHGKETIDYLKRYLSEEGTANSSDETNVIVHGAALGAGVAGMGSGDESVYDELKLALFCNSAVALEAAALGMGLVMLGSGRQLAVEEMLQFAEDTQHETIVRGLAIGIALLEYGREDLALHTIDTLIGHQNAILRYGGAFTIALAYAGTGNKDAIRKLLHIAVSDLLDDVRRALVMALGFVLLRDYTTVPTIVELLLELHNPHVRYGTALALGISCAGRGLPAAIEVLEPLAKDPVDFVRQGAMISMAMILIEENEKTFPKVTEIRKLFSLVIENKNQDALAKFGAALAQGIIDAGGRNATIQLENAHTSTLNTKAVVGLAMFTQFWYWFPLAHFLLLSFTPTLVIGVREDLKVPKFGIHCHTKPDVFGYPPKVVDPKEKAPEKMVTAVLLTTNRANARARKVKAEKKLLEMDVDTEEPADAEETVDASEEEAAEEEDEEAATQLADIPAGLDEPSGVTRYTRTPYTIENMLRVVPAQLKYVLFVKDERFVPVRKFKGAGGVVVLRDTKPQEPVEFIKTIRQVHNKDAPLPEPFVLLEEER